MKRMLLASPLLALFAAAACETVEGAGEDIQSAGRAVEQESNEVQSDL